MEITDGVTGDSAEDVVVVSVSVPDEDVADRLCAHVVDERLAACAQRGGPIRSTYRWKGAVETDTEWMVTFKTRRGRLVELVDAVRSLHPAEVPEIVAVQAVGGNPDYLAWVLAESG